MTRTAVAAAILALACAATAQAQPTEPKVGVTMGYPTSVGALWNVSERVALRPELSLIHTSDDGTSSLAGLFGSSGSSSSDLWTVGVGVSGLFYISKAESLRTYVSPRFAYTRTSISGTNTSTTAALPPIVIGGSTTTSTTSGASAIYFVSGSFGAQYSLGSRFAVFGELGLSFSDTETSTTSSSPSPSVSGIRSDASGKSIGLRSGAGVILFF